MLFVEQTLNSTSGAVKESILQQTGCLRYGRHDIFTFFGIWVNCYIITIQLIEFSKTKPRG